MRRSACQLVNCVRQGRKEGVWCSGENTFNPSSIPGPRNELALVRLALSKLDLKTNWTPQFSVMVFMDRHILNTCSCDWITFGPAITKNGSACCQVKEKEKGRKSVRDSVFLRSARVSVMHLKFYEESALLPVHDRLHVYHAWA